MQSPTIFPSIQGKVHRVASKKPTTLPPSFSPYPTPNTRIPSASCENKNMVPAYLPSSIPPAPTHIIQECKSKSFNRSRILYTTDP